MSDGEAEEYVVETITRARVAKKPGRGKRLIWQYRVKWQGWDNPNDDTWETLDSFNGSEHLVWEFWERAKASTKGRDVKDLSLFEAGEEFFPVGPPRKPGRKAQKGPTKEVSSPGAKTSEQSPPVSTSTKSIKRKRKSSVTELPRNASSSSSPFAEPHTDKSSRPKRQKRKQPSETPVVTPSTQRRRPTRNRHESPEIVPPSEDDEDVIVLPPPTPPTAESEPEAGLPRNRRRRGQSNEPSLPELSTTNTTSLDAAIQRAYTVEQEERVPVHRTRSTNPRVKMVDDFRDIDGAISVKARLSGKSESEQNSSSSTPDSSRKRKPGPGRSSTSVKKSAHSLLTFQKGELKSVKGHFKAIQAGENNLEDHVMENGVDWEPEPDQAVIPAEQDVPTGEELLELAGVSKQTTDDLADFDDDVNAATEEPALEKPTSLFQQSITSLFPAGLSAASTSVSNVVSAAWRRSTIFGPLGLASESQHTPSASSQSTSSTPFVLNVDVSVPIPVQLTDISTGNTSALDSAVAKFSSNSTPGKFYAEEGALKVLDTLRSDGPCARVIPSSNATDAQKGDFNKLQQRLSQHELFLAVAGAEILALCSPDSGLISQRLNLPASLISQSGSVLVSRVSVENYSAYANTIMEVDNLRW